VTPNVATAIEALYTAFADAPPPRALLYSPYKQLNTEPLLTKPLRTLTNDELAVYGFSVFTTIDGSDFAYFLPRLIELSHTPDFLNELEIIYGKVTLAKWHLWPHRRREAMENYIHAVLASFEEEEQWDANERRQCLELLLNHKATHATPTVVYPDSDGKPMADNTKQWRWIARYKGNLDALFAERDDVFVAGDLLWYPVQGQPSIRVAPNVLVVFGRPKGDRGSYKQFEEDNLAPQVVFEVLSPGNTIAEMVSKHLFYEHHGVEEYYLHDPDRNEIYGWVRSAGQLNQVGTMDGFVSPRLGIRWQENPTEWQIFYPDGRLFLDHAEAVAERNAAEQEVARLRALLKQHGIEPSL